MPKVSVIVPNYNHADFLPQRMDSILAQTFTDFEIILLDDCSTDASRNVLERYRSNKKVSHFILNEKNSGSAFTQWKKGISVASGQYLWIAESDDCCDADFLQKAVEKLDAGYDLFCARTVEVDENSQPRQLKKIWTDDLSPTRWQSDFENSAPDEVTEMLFRKNTIVNASGVVFRNDARVLSLLDQSVGMRYVGDWLFWMQYLLGAKRMYYCATVNNYFRSHPAVTRRAQSQQKRNKELHKILRFVLRHPASKGKRKELVRYFFKEHYQEFPKRALGKNFVLALQQFFVSPKFFGCWWTYYFG